MRQVIEEYDFTRDDPDKPRLYFRPVVPGSNSAGDGGGGYSSSSAHQHLNFKSRPAEEENFTSFTATVQTQSRVPAAIWKHEPHPRDSSPDGRTVKTPATPMESPLTRSTPVVHLPTDDPVEDDQSQKLLPAVFQEQSRVDNSPKSLPHDLDDMEVTAEWIGGSMICVQHESLDIEGGGCGRLSSLAPQPSTGNSPLPKEQHSNRLEQAFQKAIDSHAMVEKCRQHVPDTGNHLPTMVPSQIECALTRSCLADISLMRILPSWAYIVFFTPILVPVGTLHTYIQNPTTDPFEPLGRAMIAQGLPFRGVGHIPYSLRDGFTQIHEEFVRKASVVITVVCESDLNCGTTAPVDALHLVEEDQADEYMDHGEKRCLRLGQQMRFANQVLDSQKDVPVVDFGLSECPGSPDPDLFRRKPMHILVQCCTKEFRPAAAANFLNVVECAAYNEEMVEQIVKTIFPSQSWWTGMMQQQMEE